MNQHLSDVILENLLDGVLIIDTGGKIIYANQAAEKLFGKPPVELIGEHFGYPVAHKVQEIQLISNRQIFIVEMLSAIIQWQGIEACLLSFHNITELKKVSKELERQKHRLQNSNLELKQYASMDSHDLKEPLRKIMRYTQKLLLEKFQSVE